MAIKTSTSEAPKMTVISPKSLLQQVREQERYKTHKLLSRFLTYEMGAEIAGRAGDCIREYRNGGSTLGTRCHSCGNCRAAPFDAGNVQP